MNKKREESKTKRRRLESEVSQSSGITNLSNVTQTTELSSDFEDNNSDSTSVNQFVQTKRAKRQPARKHQVSWSIDNDDTFEKERVKGDKPAQQLNPGEYDNNFAGTNNSHRATESSLDTFALSYNKQRFNEACDRNNRIFQSKLRSNTTSQIHGHENEIQRQIQLDELIRRNDAQQLQSKRSQCATSLRVNSVQNMYESLQSQNAAQNMLKNNPPVQTVVHMTSNDSNYLHPVTETQIHQSRRSQSATYLRVNSVQNRSDSHLYEFLLSQNATQKMLNNNPSVQTVVHMTSNDSNYLYPVTETLIHRNNLRKAKNMPAISGDESSAYVMQHNEPFNVGQCQKKCYDFCNNSFYRKGFYILLIFNVILILLNTFGLPYVYFAINQKKEVSKAANLNEGGEFASVVHSEICVKCDKLNEVMNSSEVSIKDGQCCIKSAEKLLPILLEIVDDIAGVPPPEKKANVPVIQMRAATTRNKNQTKIIWQKKPDVGNFSSNVTDDEIKVPKTGYYYVYSRVHYNLPAYKDESEEFTIVHTIYKTKKDDTESPLEEVVQRCFPTNNTGDVRHANQLGSIHHLKKDDRLYIELRYPQYLLPENTLFGMFMVAT